MVIKDVFESEFPESNAINEESPGSFPELNDLAVLAKPQVISRSNTPTYNTRDVEVHERVDKETQFTSDVTIKISNSLPLYGEEVKQRLSMQTDLSKTTRVQAHGTTLPIFRRDSSTRSQKDENTPAFCLR